MKQIRKLSNLQPKNGEIPKDAYVYASSVLLVDNMIIDKVNELIDQVNTLTQELSTNNG